MIHIERAANDILNKFFEPEKPSWEGDKIEGYVLKMENDGPICSAIIYQTLANSTNWVFIHALGTNVNHRNKGYARALLENLMKMDVAPQMIFVEAKAIKGGPHTMIFFRNLGFIPSPTHDEQVKIDIQSLGIGDNKTLVLDNKA
jgi:GNAT superfamily N-acetyltransferase